MTRFTDVLSSIPMIADISSINRIQRQPRSAR